jgi:energy-coupling factor transport system permease protein
LMAIAIRMLLFTLLGTGPGTTTLFRLPEVPLPDWLAGVRLGGEVTLDGTLAAAYDGLRLGVILICVGAANTLTSPRRLLKSMPSALQEAGVAVTVALSFAPQAVASVGRLRSARRLRGRADRGPRSLRGLAVPVLEGVLDRSVDLAAAMDARGFGRRGPTSNAVRRTTSALVLGGLAMMAISSYALVDESAPQTLGLPVLTVGAAACAVGFAVGARRGGRTRYRPDPWRTPEWLVIGCAAAAVTCTLLASSTDLFPSTSPPVAPTLPWLPAVGLLLALLPAWITPPLPRPRTVTARIETTAREPVGVAR